eukprot:scaffold501506_cov18-Prasinocladus_malaysianus.AAC.1
MAILTKWYNYKQQYLTTITTTTTRTTTAARTNGHRTQKPLSRGAALNTCDDLLTYRLRKFLKATARDGCKQLTLFVKLRVSDCRFPLIKVMHNEHKEYWNDMR